MATNETGSCFSLPLTLNLSAALVFRRCAVFKDSCHFRKVPTSRRAVVFVFEFRFLVVPGQYRSAALARADRARVRCDMSRRCGAARCAASPRVACTAAPAGCAPRARTPASSSTLRTCRASSSAAAPAGSSRTLCQILPLPGSPQSYPDQALPNRTD